jgi:hypothetical protein
VETTGALTAKEVHHVCVCVCMCMCVHRHHHTVICISNHQIYQLNNIQYTYILFYIHTYTNTYTYIHVYILFYIHIGGAGRAQAAAGEDRQTDRAGERSRELTTSSSTIAHTHI